MALYQTTLGLKLPDLLTVEKWSTAQENENKQLLNDAIEDDRSALEQIRLALAAARVPAGAIQIHASVTAPAGYLLCQGQSVLRSAYPELFASIGVGYGSASTTTFNIPNLVGRVIVGTDPAQGEFTPIGRTGGAKTHTLNTNEIPNHTHTFKNGGNTFNWGANMGPGTVYIQNAIATVGPPPSNNLTTIQGSHNSTESSGGAGGGHNNLQPYAAMQYIIKI
jgi:microcystin-dependent protein